LIEHFARRGSCNARVIDFASGSGRNGAALRHAGFDVVSIDDRTAMTGFPLDTVEGSFDAVISTHGLLHGTIPAIAGRVERFASRLAPGGLLFATLGSTRDARFGKGRRVDAATYVPLDGDERGVAHSYFSRSQLETLLLRWYEIESLEERLVDAVAGRWAHPKTPLEKAVHWFVEARVLEAARPSYS
jgi:SAM-dependent methyltransferase